MTNRIWRGLASLAVAAAVALIGGPASATAVNCTTTPGLLVTDIAAISPGATSSFTLTGTCTGNISPPSNTTISGGTIAGTVTINGASNVVLSGVTIDASTISNHTQAVVVENSGTVTLTNCAIQNWLGSNFGAVTAVQGGTLIMNGGLIQSITTEGGFAYASIYVGAGGVAALTNVDIIGNFTGVTVVGGKASLAAMNINSNSENAVSATQSDLQITGGTISGATSVSTPTIALVRSSLIASGSAMIAAPSHGNAIYATPGSIVQLEGAQVTSSDAADPTILVSDGSTLLSAGGNTISNSGVNGTAMSITNSSTFHQRNETLLGTTLAADTLTGAATVQMESNMELGTGASTPSSWTGVITVAQNSAFRMDGGMTVTGSVSLTQGSNGFFNKSAGGTNTVTDGVTCSGTGTSHVVGPAAVVTSGSTSAVTIVSSGAGCYNF
jgi:hypothetical protein